MRLLRLSGSFFIGSIGSIDFVPLFQNDTWLLSKSISGFFLRYRFPFLVVVTEHVVKNSLGLRLRQNTLYSTQDPFCTWRMAWHTFSIKKFNRKISMWCWSHITIHNFIHKWDRSTCIIHIRSVAKI